MIAIFCSRNQSSRLQVKEPRRNVNLRVNDAIIVLRLNWLNCVMKMVLLPRFPFHPPRTRRIPVTTTIGGGHVLPSSPADGVGNFARLKIIKLIGRPAPFTFKVINPVALEVTATPQQANKRPRLSTLPPFRTENGIS